MSTRTAWGIGLATVTDDDQTLDVWYPRPTLGEAPKDSSGPYSVPADLASLAVSDRARRTRQVVRHVHIDLDAAPADAADAYLRLHLLSHRLAKPNTINLDGLFAVLPNVVWTSAGPCAVENFDQTRLALRVAAKGAHLHVFGVDKFPRMTNYVLPSGVRIADADRVRLGAYLAEGTTVMHEGFVNFNAGTLGASMVEGRISQGVVVGEGTDIGGGSSIMGTLSGGGHHQVTIGRRCLLGANAGVGISLGDDCVVEAGLYVTAGTKISLQGEHGPDLVSARELSGQTNLLFRRHSVTGAVEAIRRESGGARLNTELHAQ